ncbi:uncharacterized protein LOC110980361 [Acanthaster planci]|uniref:Uncharacterized protein LOC110980361 n=1 Tax=Acanthaster planci TaxID=133434 RepID=A0A8B7YMG5_ACAPL|nr:uncharacterized protein LOC110980361 [Acanthaster planci]
MGKYREKYRWKISLVRICAMCGLIAGTKAQCFVGNEPDSRGGAAWVMPTRDPCVCRGKALSLGGLNIRPLTRPFKPTYINLSDMTTSARSSPAFTGLTSCPDKIQCHKFDNVSDEVYRYEFAKLPKFPGDKVLVNFSVRAQSDVYISLTSQNKDVNDMYEIIIGRFYGVKSAIRRCSECSDLVSDFKVAGRLLDRSEFKHFWVSAIPGKQPPDQDVERSTLIVSVGLGSEEAFMTYEDSSPLSVEYLGFKQGDNTLGSYEFCGLELRE